eukprot:symbB.v1.2.023725.t1/scaffold2194.1/size86169/2
MQLHTPPKMESPKAVVQELAQVCSQWSRLKLFMQLHRLQESLLQFELHVMHLESTTKDSLIPEKVALVTPLLQGLRVQLVNEQLLEYQANPFALLEMLAEIPVAVATAQATGLLCEQQFQPLHHQLQGIYVQLHRQDVLSAPADAT